MFHPALCTSCFFFKKVTREQMHPLDNFAQCVLQIICMVHDHLMLHTSDFMGIIITCNSKRHTLEGLLVMWKIVGRTWWVCSSYLVATGCCLSPYCVWCWGAQPPLSPCTGAVPICVLQCTKRLLLHVLPLSSCVNTRLL